MKESGPKEKIDAIFEEKWPSADLSDEYKLDFRAKIAQDKLNSETEEYRAVLKKQAEEAFEEKMKQYQQALDGGDIDSIASDDPDIQAM